jgi:hypothetical protein
VKVDDREDDADVPVSGQAVGGEEREHIFPNGQIEIDMYLVAFKAKDPGSIAYTIAVRIFVLEGERQVAQPLALEALEIEPRVGERQVELTGS